LLVSCVDQPEPGSTNALDVCFLSPDGALCDDGQPCTANDVCVNRRCVGAAVADGTTCTDGNVCTSNDRCVAAVCRGTALADGTACTDDDPCTGADYCQASRCQSGAPTVCDDGDPCTIDMCAPTIGCVFSSRDCVSVDASLDWAPDAVPTDATSTPVEAGAEAGLDASANDGDDAAPIIDAQDDQSVGPDAVDATTEVDAGQDAAVDAEVDARDGAVDLAETPPDLRARGGGCNCALADAGGAGDGVVPSLLALVAGLVLSRRRARRGTGRRGRKT
jgi:hypothetical protein